jgi:CubicO group peptidase (beta-lactamase class C family)
MKKWLSFLFVGMLCVPEPANSDALANDPRVASAIRLLEVWVETQLAYEAIPGISMGIVHDQDLIWSRGFGYANPDEGLEASPTTMYSICSISKLFTSISVMQLRDDGKLRLDDPVGKHLSWFNIQDTYPDAPEVTIQGVLTHSSGLPREAGFPYWTGPEYPFPTHEQIMERISSLKELYPANTYFQYSNLGLTLAGEIVAAASGESYADYVRGNILDPLGLNNTHPEIPDQHRRKQLAVGYSRRQRDGSRNVMPDYLVRGIAPAAGFVSTVEDLARFASWQLRLLEKGGHEVLDANTLKEMQRVHWIDPNWETTWGLGFSVSRVGDTTYVGHGGTCPGYRTLLRISPKDKIAVIFMTNSIANTRPYAREAFEIVGPAIAKALEKPDQGKEVDPSLRKYVGRYDRDFRSETQVLIMNGKLAMLYVPTENPSAAVIKLMQVEGHTFRRIRDDGELGEPIVFELDADGKVTRFKRHGNYSERVY